MINIYIYINWKIIYLKKYINNQIQIFIYLIQLLEI